MYNNQKEGKENKDLLTAAMWEIRLWNCWNCNRANQKFGHVRNLTDCPRARLLIVQATNQASCPSQTDRQTATDLAEMWPYYKISWGTTASGLNSGLICTGPASFKGYSVNFVLHFCRLNKECAKPKQYVILTYSPKYESSWKEKNTATVQMTPPVSQMPPCETHTSDL